MTCRNQLNLNLPDRPNSDYYRKQAKYLFRAFKSHEPGAEKRFSSLLDSRPQSEQSFVSLSDAQTVIAREYGCSNWPAFLKLIHNNSLKQPAETFRKRFADKLYSLKKITSQNVHAAFSDVPREKFIGSPPWCFPEFYWYPYLGHLDNKLENIYQDTQVNPNKRSHCSNGIPSTQAKWIEALNLNRGEKVLHIGCDNGYYTAIISQLVGVEGEVYFFDKSTNLTNIAKSNLSDIEQAHAVKNIKKICETGFYDVILINAGVRKLKTEWLSALKEQGRILVPLVAPYVDSQVGYGEILLIGKSGEKFEARFMSPANYSRGGYYPYFDEADSATDDLIKEAYSKKGYKSVRSLRLDPHQCDDSCWLHQESYCLSKQAA
jgi:protein-L-isoaspartate(D-aspartate) O-methyltransferase